MARVPSPCHEPTTRVGFWRSLSAATAARQAGGVRIHLDTDFAGDTDDAAALAMLLGCPEADITAITTTADPDGRRAGYVRRVLDMAGRGDIPVVAGAGASLTTGAEMGGIPDHDRYWGGERVVPQPPSLEGAVDLMRRSLDAGAVLVGIGPYTDLAAVEAAHPGALAEADVVLMGGWVRAPAEGLPPWRAENDWNVQCDTNAAVTVFDAAGRLRLVTLPATLQAHLRAADVPALEAAGPIGRLLARQARAHAEDRGIAALAKAHPGLPDDLLNFQYDPVACAVAVGWNMATMETMHLRPVREGGVLHFEEVADGKAVEVATAVDGDAFSGMWLQAVANADRR